MSQLQTYTEIKYSVKRRLMELKQIKPNIFSWKNIYKLFFSRFWLGISFSLQIFYMWTAIKQKLSAMTNSSSKYVILYSLYDILFMVYVKNIVQHLVIFIFIYSFVDFLEFLIFCSNMKTVKHENPTYSRDI